MRLRGSNPPSARKSDRHARHAPDDRRALLVWRSPIAITADFWPPKWRRSTIPGVTPAHTMYDGQNYEPTHKWVLFGHHFAAISGAGPLIGPVLAIQFGYLPGLIWMVVGVCLAGAVQDMLVLAASVRHGGRSLAEIARAEIGTLAGTTASITILLVVVVALAGLGIVVVKALGGEEIKLAPGTVFTLPAEANIEKSSDAGERLRPNSGRHEDQIRRRRIEVTRSESFRIAATRID